MTREEDKTQAVLIILAFVAGIAFALASFALWPETLTSGLVCVTQEMKELKRYVDAVTDGTVKFCFQDSEGSLEEMRREICKEPK